MTLPLAVDLDGTLIKTDLLFETLLAVLRRRPLALLLLPVWLLRGRAHLKARLAALAGDEVDVGHLPLTEDLVAFLKSEKAAGRRIELVSASDQRLVDKVAERVGVFDASLGSDGTVNLKGEAKAALLAARHPDGFAYAGDSRADLAVWSRAAAAIPVNAALRMRADVERLAPVEAAFGSVPDVARALWRALRPYQWAKNGLILVPMLLTRSYEIETTLLATLLVVAMFSAVASGTYLVNDLLDLTVDRMHPGKRNRPLASGRLPLPIAIGLAPVLIGAGLGGAALVDGGVAFCLLAYLALTLGYSFGLKAVPVVDVLTLGGLFTLRLFAGHTLIDGGVPAWLLVFSMALFTSLALIKRLTEVKGLNGRNLEAIPGRGYRAGDDGFILTLGLTTGVASVLVFMIYLVAEPLHSTRLDDPAWLWVVPAVLGYWVPRAWLLAARGQMNDDPVLFALRDRTSLALGGIALAAVLLAG